MWGGFQPPKKNAINKRQDVKYSGYIDVDGGVQPPENVLVKLRKILRAANKNVAETTNQKSTGETYSPDPCNQQSADHSKVDHPMVWSQLGLARDLCHQSWSRDIWWAYKTGSAIELSAMQWLEKLQQCCYILWWSSLKTHHDQPSVAMINHHYSPSAVPINSDTHWPWSTRIMFMQRNRPRPTIKIIIHQQYNPHD